MNNAITLVQFKRFGHLPFQTEVGKRVQGGDKAERYALLLGGRAA